MQHFDSVGAQSQGQCRPVVKWAGISAGISSLCVCEDDPATSPQNCEAQHRARQCGTGNWAVFSQLHSTRTIPVSSSHRYAHVLHPIPLLHQEQTLWSPVCNSAAGMRGAEGVLHVHWAGILLRLCSVRCQPLYLDNQTFSLCFCWPLVEARQMKRKK